VIALDSASYEAVGRRHPRADDGEDDHEAQERRALRFALAEYDLKQYEVRAGDNLGAVLT
jgi:hypothetical protein